MPVVCRQIEGKWRLVETDGKIATNKKGTPVDGGGHSTKGGCTAQARAINATHSLSNVVYIPPRDHSLWLEQHDNSGLVYTKELIYAGEFRQGDGHEFTVDELLLDHWANTFVEMLANGVEVPLPLQHTDNPEANRGKVLGMAVKQNNDGVPALFAKVQFRDKEAAQLAKTAQVSLFSPPEFVDGQGNRYIRPIRHVALTDYPVIPKLGGFESIAASFHNPDCKECDDMALLDLTKRLNIECAEEDKAEDAIVLAFETNTTTIAERDETIKAKDAEIATLKKKVPSDPVKVIASHRNMLKDNRTMKLDKLVGDAKISPAVKDTLLEVFCGDDQLNLVLSQENADDNFDRIVEALGKNEIVELGGTVTGPQGGTPLDKTKVTDNPLLADAEKRAKAASK